MSLTTERNYSLDIAGAFLRTHKPEDELIRDEDFFGLLARRDFERRGILRENDSNLNRRIVGGALALHFATVSVSKHFIEGRLGKRFASGAVILNVHNQDDSRYISAHYLGDKDYLGRLPEDLSRIAKMLDKARRKRNSKLPDVIKAKSSHHMMFAVGKMLGIPSECEESSDPREVAGIFTISDAARAVKGNRPCRDRRIYTISMPTNEFIERFLPREE